MVPEYEERAASEMAGIPFPHWRTETGPSERGGAIAYLRYKRLVEASVQEAASDAASAEARRQSRGRGA